MDRLDGMLDQLLAEDGFGCKPEEREARLVLMTRLFAFYEVLEADHKLEVYLAETEEIPLDKLVLTLRLLRRTNPYPRLPSIADLWKLARHVAGMDREQYRAGHYIPPPRHWPPRGQRHAITAGELEEITPALLGSGAVALLGGGDGIDPDAIPDLFD